MQIFLLINVFYFGLAVYSLKGPLHIIVHIEFSLLSWWLLLMSLQSVEKNILIKLKNQYLHCGKCRIQCSKTLYLSCSHFDHSWNFKGNIHVWTGYGEITWVIKEQVGCLHSPLFLCWLIGWFVGGIAQKVLYRFQQIVVGGWVSVQKRPQLTSGTDLDNRTEPGFFLKLI